MPTGRSKKFGMMLCTSGNVSRPKARKMFLLHHQYKCSQSDHVTTPVSDTLGLLISQLGKASI